MRARDRRAPGDVLVDEIRDDRPLKLPLEIDDVVGEVQTAGHTSCVMQVVEAAATAVTGFSAALIVELHRQTDNLVARFGEKRRGHRGIDAA